MSTLADDASRTDILNRLKRAEGQLRGIQRMIAERLIKLCTRQMQVQLLVANYCGQFDRLMINTEGMLPEPNRAVAIGEQIATIALLTQGVVRDRLQFALHIVSADRIAKFNQLRGDLSNFLDHQI